ncbi:hypothetical protein JHK82_040211 [Glycine max]|nr:hypothetical protein JHK86_040410 [Glycine max]KAG4966020.1 hypothetical protein JHK85_040995 [Glycine max]KAG5110988.1 hypothetical protein JHK82_040211 [Glycine max]KAG5122280.1 hypothetical protein JHK84_040620 [Glycine max]
MVGVLLKRRILMQHGKSQGNRDTTTYTTTLHHNIQSMAQGMTQVLCAGEHLHRVMDSKDCSLDWRIQFYMSPYAHTQKQHVCSYHNNKLHCSGSQGLKSLSGRWWILMITVFSVHSLWIGF